MITKFTKALMMLTISAILFSSCSEDEEMTVIDETNLVGGTWTFSVAETEDSFNKAFLDTFLEGTTYSFKADGTYTGIGVLGFDGDGTWVFADNKLTIDEGTELEEQYEVTELSSKTMKLYSPEYEEDGETIPAATLVYTK